MPKSFLLRCPCVRYGCVTGMIGFSTLAHVTLQQMRKGGICQHAFGAAAAAAINACART